MSRVMLVVLLVALLLTASACQPREDLRPFDAGDKYSTPLPPGELALRRIDPSAYPDFSRAYYERAGLRRAIENSLEYLTKPSSQKYFPYGEITHDRARVSLQAMLRLLDEAASPEDLDRLIRERFDVYQSVGWDGGGAVFFTGYYTPIFDGRRQRDNVYRYPLYKLPPDLLKDAEGRILGRRTPDGRVAPYYTRREIEERGLLEGGEVAWLKDPFEAYIVTVQGSAKLRLADNSIMELGYAGNNGHEYASVREALIEDGLLRRDEASLQSMMRLFAARPELVKTYCWRNSRYVFFDERDGGPRGSINVPVTTLRTIATDKDVFPRACLAFVDTNVARNFGGRVSSLPYSAFALDQDTGGAIRAAGRCDIYMGVGDDAEAIAGRTAAEGRLYYLFVKPEAVAVRPGSQNGDNN